jgi:hypothetical protein
VAVGLTYIHSMVLALDAMSIFGDLGNISRAM